MESLENLHDRLMKFDAISLPRMNQIAPLQKRQETKYLVTEEMLVQILKKLRKHYFILEHRKFRLFRYKSTYMDSNQLLFYNDHENSKQARIKVRKRKYVDTGEVFIEYKVKTGANMDKERLALDNSDSGDTMDVQSDQFFKDLYKQPLEIRPTMKTNYFRITLCSKTVEERITIDLNLTFRDPRNTENGELTVNDFVIIEVKQAIGATDDFCKKIIADCGGTVAEGCSKYCLGLIYFNKVDKYTHFQKTLDYIEENGGVHKKSTGERVNYATTTS